MTASAPPTNEPSHNEIDLGVLNEVLGFRLRRIQNELSRSFAERVGRKELRPGGFSALALIAANPGLSQTTLSREIGFDKATVVAIIDSLEHLGWAERQRSSTDRRRHSLYITPKGEKALVRLRDTAMANEERIHTLLNEAEQAQLFVLLDKIYTACFTGEA